MFLAKADRCQSRFYYSPRGKHVRNVSSERNIHSSGYGEGLPGQQQPEALCHVYVWEKGFRQQHISWEGLPGGPGRDSCWDMTLSSPSVYLLWCFDETADSRQESLWLAQCASRKPNVGRAASADGQPWLAQFLGSQKLLGSSLGCSLTPAEGFLRGNHSRIFILGV